MINWNTPSFGEKEIELVTEVLKSGYVSEGKFTDRTEKRLCKVIGCKHVILTTSCTAAIYLSIEAFKEYKLRKGINISNPRVFIPNLNFVSDKNACELANCEIKYLDVNDRYLMDCNHMLDGEIFIPVNLLGKGISLETISKLREKNKFIICDNAGCLGSNVPIGDIGCYSLQANKLISSGGQGGLCATNDDELAEIIRQLKDFGRKDKLDNNTSGFNFKFNDIQAAILVGQLEQLDNRTRLHLKQYLTYKKELGEFGKFIEYKKGEVPLWVEFKCKDQLERNALIDYLKDKDINCRKPWKPIINVPDKFPKSFEYYREVIWLPNGRGCTNREQKYIIEEVKKFYGGI